MKFKKIKKPVFVLSIILLFVSVVMIYYMKGYTFDSPKSCTVCHIMQETYDSWQKSTHNKVTNCNDCHISQKGNKFKEKTKTGYHHTVDFILNRYSKPITLPLEKYDIVIENCYRCHNHPGYAGGFYEVHHKNQMECTKCHYNTHGYPIPSCTQCHNKSSHNKT
jgi:cytochrome c nitrite reductase small subunit